MKTLTLHLFTAAVLYLIYNSICTAQCVLLQTTFFLVNIDAGFQFQDIVNVVDRVFEQFSLSSFYKGNEEINLFKIKINRNASSKPT